MDEIQEITFGQAMVDEPSFQNRQGNPQSVALALSPDKHYPVDAMGFPVGKSSDYVAKAIKRPVGISNEEWLTAIEVATEHFRLTSGIIRPSLEILSSLSSLPKSTWELIYSEDNLRSFEAALALKGILRKGAGLTYDQMRCLRYLTDVTVRGTLETRLKHLNISWERFQNWQRDARFNEQFKAISEEVLDQAQPLVMMELTRQGVRGNLEAIKYFHQVTGRYDGAVSAADLQAFLNGLVEILQLEVSDAPTLRRIGLKLAKLRKETLTNARNTD
jgi:hypothetical protein